MIGRLRGIILEKQPPNLLVDVNGIGYELEAPMTTFYNLPAIGEEIQLYTHLAIRDDAHLLFGFATEDERYLFRTLIKVNGAGAKMALTILSGIESSEFAACIQQGDSERLVKLPGVGKKTAERMALELKEKVVKIMPTELTGPAGVREDVLSALLNLGYKRPHAEAALAQLGDDVSEFEELLRRSLRALAR